MTNIMTAAQLLLGPALIGARQYRAVSGSDILTWLTLGAIVVAAIIGGAHLANFMVQYWKHKSPLSLFYALCKANQLNNIKSMALLKQVARYHKLKNPGLLFVEPKWLDPTQIRGPLRSKANEIGRIRSILFVDSV